MGTAFLLNLLPLDHFSQESLSCSFKSFQNSVFFVLTFWVLPALDLTLKFQIRMFHSPGAPLSKDASRFEGFCTEPPKTHVTCGTQLKKHCLFLMVINNQEWTEKTQVPEM
jgi:hypothetical protein